MRFEWDEAKNRSNQVKHGISVEAAAESILDPNVVLIQDRFVDGEQRWHAIGATREWAVLLVVHVHCRENEHGQEEVIRIISAREANKRERRVYIDPETE